MTERRKNGRPKATCLRSREGSGDEDEGGVTAVKQRGEREIVTLPGTYIYDVIFSLFLCNKCGAGGGLGLLFTPR